TGQPEQRAAVARANDAAERTRALGAIPHAVPRKQRATGGREHLEPTVADLAHVGVQPTTGDVHPPGDALRIRNLAERTLLAHVDLQGDLLDATASQFGCEANPHHVARMPPSMARRIAREGHRMNDGTH